MESFKNSYGVVLKQGHALMANLDEEHIDEIFARSAKDIEGSWTTHGLIRSMDWPAVIHQMAGCPNFESS